MKLRSALPSYPLQSAASKMRQRAVQQGTGKATSTQTTPSAQPNADPIGDVMEAFGRLVGNLLQAPTGMLKTGNEQALGQFLRNGQFDQGQLMKDLNTLASKMASVPLTALSPTSGLGPFSGNAGSPAGGLGPFSGSGSSTTLAQGQVGDVQSGGIRRQGQLRTAVGDLAGQLALGHQLKKHAQGDISVGPDGLKAQGQAELAAQVGGQARGSFRSGLVDADFGAKAQLGPRAWAQGQATANLKDGIKAQGSAGAELQGNVELNSSIRSALFRNDTTIRAGGAIGAKAQGDLSLNQNGLQAKGSIGAKAEVGAQLQSQFQTIGVDVGGERLDVNGQVKAFARAGARAGADVDIAATIAPPRLGVDAEAGAFAGAKAGVEGKVGLGDFVSVKGRAEAWVGAGAQAGFTGGLKDGKLSFGFHAGAAVKAGAGFRWSVELDIPKLAKAAVGGGLQMAERALEFATDPGKAIGHALQDIAGALGQKTPGTIPLGAPQSPLPLSKLLPMLDLNPQVQQGAQDVISNVIDQIFSDPAAAQERATP